jgi:hypothetical protein
VFLPGTRVVNRLVPVVDRRITRQTQPVFDRLRRGGAQGRPRLDRFEVVRRVACRVYGRGSAPPSESTRELNQNRFSHRPWY